MNLNIFIFFNKVIHCFTTPNFDDHSAEDAATQLARSLTLYKTDEKIVKNYRFLDMYHIGTFNDETGEITKFSEPVKLLDCSQVLGIELPVVEEDKKEEITDEQ